MKTINTIIDTLLTKRNTRKTEKLVSFCDTRFLQAQNLSLLDLGCGNGLFAARLKQLPQVSEVWGVDVIDYRKTDIPFKQYSEGKPIPFNDNSFDYTFIVEVLHHSDNADFLLHEAKRVTRERIIIFEDVVTSDFRLLFMRMFDTIMNMRHGVHTPLLFKSQKEWETVFMQSGLTCEKVFNYSFYSIPTPQLCKVFQLKV